MFEKLLPPAKWRFPVMIVSAIFIGIAAFTVYISKAHSYLSDKPETCINCHIMAPQYATWSHSSHREVAHCNDCHVPHNNVFNKYYFKASDGLRHSALFTLRKERQVITILEAGPGWYKTTASDVMTSRLWIPNWKQRWPCTGQFGKAGDVLTVTGRKEAMAV
jgi:cytochrome c nitrite reductase small subunit